jgi:hypothetical protein
MSTTLKVSNIAQFQWGSAIIDYRGHAITGQVQNLEVA